MKRTYRHPSNIPGTDYWEVTLNANDEFETALVDLAAYAGLYHAVTRAGGLYNYNLIRVEVEEE